MRHPYFRDIRESENKKSLESSKGAAEGGGGGGNSNTNDLQTSGTALKSLQSSTGANATISSSTINQKLKADFKPNNSSTGKEILIIYLII